MARAWTDEEIEWFGIINESALFEEDFYLETCPEAGEGDRKPLAHYIESGAYEGKNPNRWFDAEWYKENYKEVKESGINPFAHYLLYGRDMGYFCNSDDKKEAEAKSAETESGEAYTERERELLSRLDEVEEENKLLLENLMKVQEALEEQYNLNQKASPEK